MRTYIYELITYAKINKQLMAEQIKGITEEELHFLVDHIVSGSESMKACVYQSMTNNI